MPETPDVRIQLAAYLAGELDDDAVEALEARMQSEPLVADAADEMADMLVELQAVEEVDPPTGFADRLRAGLADEIGHELPQASRLDPDVVRASGAAALDGWSTTARGRRDRPAGTRPGDRHRQQTRRARFGRAAMAVAAGLVVLFVGTTAVFVSSSSDDSADTGDSVEEGVAESTVRTMDDEAAFAGGAADVAEEEREDAAAELAPDMDESADVPAPLAAEEAPAEDAAEEAVDETTADDAGDDDAADGGAADTGPAGATAASVGPALLELGEIGGDDEAVRTSIGDDPAAAQLLGRSNDDAEQLAIPFRDEILRAEPFAGGTEPGACLAEVLRDADGVVVPAVAASFTADGDPRLGYALVRSSNGDRLDRTDVWVVEPGGCTVLAVVS